MTSTTLYADLAGITAEADAIELLKDELGARVITEPVVERPQWRGFTDRDAREDQLEYELMSEELAEHGW